MLGGTGKKKLKKKQIVFYLNFYQALSTTDVTKKTELNGLGHLCTYCPVQYT